jgi:hypothetical protein
MTAYVYRKTGNLYLWLGEASQCCYGGCCTVSYRGYRYSSMMWFLPNISTRIPHNPVVNPQSHNVDLHCKANLRIRNTSLSTLHVHVEFLRVLTTGKGSDIYIGRQYSHAFGQETSAVYSSMRNRALISFLCLCICDYMWLRSLQYVNVTAYRTQNCSVQLFHVIRPQR